MPSGWKEEKSYQASQLTEIQENSSADSIQNLTEQEAPELTRMEVFMPEEPRRNLDNLVVSQIVRSRIDTALNQILYRTQLYDSNGWNLQSVDPYGARTAINLFGPAGTGKTFCAEAIANHLGRKIIKANYADLESKYVGETSKNIVAAFKKARETNSVLFFDEADAILSKRLTIINQSADSSVNQSRSVMLIQLDTFDGLVIFATNFARNYDGAFVRRILAHIEFELPNKECLIGLWNNLLPREVPRSENISSEWLASISEGLAGGDILNVVKLAAGRAVARIGDDKKVTQADVLDVIEQVRQAKEKISSTPISEKLVFKEKEEEIQVDDLPLDVKASYKEALDNQNLSDD